MRIKEILQEKGITQKQFAESLGMTATGLNLLLNGGNPPLARLREMARILGVPLSDFFTDEGASERMVMFLHFQGESRTPATLEEVMSILAEWQPEKFGEMCHTYDMERIRAKYADNAEIMETADCLAALIGKADMEK